MKKNQTVILTELKIIKIFGVRVILEGKTTFRVVIWILLDTSIVGAIVNSNKAVPFPDSYKTDQSNFAWFDIICDCIDIGIDESQNIVGVYFKICMTSIVP